MVICLERGADMHMAQLIPLPLTAFLVPAYPGCPGKEAIKWLLLLLFVGAKFYCPHVLADSNQCIRIREKTLEFSSTVLSALSLYL